MNNPIEEFLKEKLPQATENNWMLFTVPQAIGDHGIDVPFFLGAVFPEPDQLDEVKDFAALLPPKWEGKFTERKYKINGGDETTDLSADWFASRQITHLVLLESNEVVKDATPFYFVGQKITHNSALLWWSEETGKYHMFHCRACAMTVLGWITKSQIEWEGYATATRN